MKVLKNNRAIYSFNFVFLLLLLLFAVQPVFAVKRALLIGISDYQDNTRVDGYRTEDLEGPKYDAISMRQTLLEHWGFDSDNVVTLTDKEATKKAILDAMKALARVSQKGDNVMIYFSGHGIRSKDRSKAGAEIRTGILVPHDFKRNSSSAKNTQQFIISSRDYRDQVLKVLDKKNVHTWLVIDACFSGVSYKSIFPKKSQERYTEAPHDIYNDQYTDDKKYPYDNNSIVFFGASTLNQSAWDIAKTDLKKHPTYDGNPHGAFTDALLRVMRGEAAGAGRKAPRTYVDYYRKVGNYLEDNGFSQYPQLIPRSIDFDSSGRNVLVKRNVLNTVPQNNHPLANKKIDMNRTIALNTVSVPSKNKSFVNFIKESKVLKYVKKDSRYTIVDENSYWEIRNKNGEIISRFSALHDRYRLIRAIERFVWARALDLEYDSKGATLNAEFQDGRIRKILPVGVTEKLRVQAERKSNFAVINIGPTGDVSINYPVNLHEGKARKKIDFPLNFRENTANGKEILLILAANSLSTKGDWRAYFGKVYRKNVNYSLSETAFNELRSLISQQADLSVKLMDIETVLAAN